jgi:hypothetical protein
MNTREVIIKLSPRHYQLLQGIALKMGKAPETLSREILEQALQQTTMEPPPDREAVRLVLRAAGRAQSLSPALRQRIIPGVTLEEVQESLAQAGGKPLSEIILEQRGPRP